jgi:manganese/iron transport system substrate-binding protein
VVATTTIVADVVKQVGGDRIELIALIPPGSDPHSFEPTPQDIAKVADADVVFANGAGLEEFLDVLIESAGATERVVHVSEGIDFIQIESAHAEEEQEGEEEEHGHKHEGVDPHTWTEPNNVIIWVDNIQKTLSELDGAHAAVYQENAQKYQQELKDLDAWIKEQVKTMPVEDRLIVTDHKLFSYFARQYDFTQVGAIFPGYSTLSSPSAKELAALEDAIRQYDVKAVLVGNTVNPDLAERVAEDTGTKLIFIYTGSLSDEQSNEVSSYLDYMRYNVGAILEGLK